MIPFSFMGSSDFNARSIANCRSWHRASLGVTNVSGACSSWADQSGAADANRDMTQGTAGNRPTITASDANFNNRQVLTFDGTNDVLISGVWTGGTYAQPITIYSVSRHTALGNYVLYDDADNTSRVAFLDGTGGSGHPFMFAGTSLTGTGGDYPINTTHVICCVFNGASSAAYIKRYNTAAVSGAAGANALKSLRVGAHATNILYYPGKVAEVITYSGSHDATTRQTVMESLGRMYGVTITS